VIVIQTSDLEGPEEKADQGMFCFDLVLFILRILLEELGICLTFGSSWTSLRLKVPG
jgi:hypothetical protein